MRKKLLFSFLCSLFFLSAACAEDQNPSMDDKLSKYIQYDLAGVNNVGYLSIDKDRGIDNSTHLYVKYALEYFRKQNVCFVVLRLNTPGGEVFAAIKIAEELKRLDAEYHIPVVAFIDNWALSAGALLAYSCRFIGIVGDASMGAAEPVIAGEGGGMQPASEKINSALRAEFANTASFYGRDPLIAEAMVDKDILLVQRHGKMIRLEKEEEIRPDDEIISREGKLLTLSAYQLVHLSVADFKVDAVSLAPLTEEEKSKDVWPAHKSLLFQQSFFAKIPHAELLGYQDWKIDFFAFLMHPLVSSLLFMGLLLGVYGEMSHPGAGIFGSLALICMALILLSSFALQTIHFLEIILLVSGLVLVAIELFLLPSFGILGVVGIVLSIVGLMALLLPHVSYGDFSWDTSDWSVTAIEFVTRLSWLIGALVVSMIIASLLARYLTKKNLLWQKLILRGEQNKEEGFTSLSFDLPEVGSEGETYTPLRPSGKVLIHDMLYDACADGFFIDKGTSVIVIAHEGSTIIVKIRKK